MALQGRRSHYPHEDIPYNTMPCKTGYFSPQNHVYLETSSSNVSHPCAKKILAGRSHLLSMLYRFPGTKPCSSVRHSLTATSKRDPELECGLNEPCRLDSDPKPSTPSSVNANVGSQSLCNPSREILCHVGEKNFLLCPCSYNHETHGFSRSYGACAVDGVAARQC